ncbi:hypothetical protein F5Y16DRAFT_373099 [Xylariaceae sp. FL0255]|nr:hypothetical protein F5Y16DRAFT_373099 [Xylariaceae sp. FL0255]
MTSEEQAQQVNIATTVLTLTILLTRTTLSFWRAHEIREVFDTSFGLVLASIVTVTARIIANTYYLNYGDADEAASVDPDYLQHYNLSHLRTGSILVLVARALITVVLWLQVCILLLFYSRITSGIPWVRRVIKATWVLTAATFVVVELVTFFECMPTSLFWRVDPPPPTRCVLAYGQLFTQAISNIVLDLLLIVIAWPIVQLNKRTFAQHVTLYTLFALGTFCTIISIIRLVSVHDAESSQTVRSLWASIQMFIATFVANAPSIYSFLRGSVLARRSIPRFNFHDEDRNQYVSTIGSGLSSTRTGTNGGRRSGAGIGRDSILMTRGSKASGSFDPSSSRREVSWLKMDDSDVDGSMPVAAGLMLKPLPPATTFYDEESAPSPFSHGHELGYAVGQTKPLSPPPFSHHGHDGVSGGAVGYAIGQTAPLSPPPLRRDNI